MYLAAIEDENWKAIGAPVYTRGFLRTYARFLGVDPEQAVAEYNTASGSAQSVTASSPGTPVGQPYREPRSLAPLLWIAGAVALALIGFVIYLYVSPPKTSPLAGGVPTASALASRQAAVSPSVIPTARPQRRTLVVHLTAPSWLRVTVDGNVSIEGTFPAGTTKTFHGKSALIRVGNAGGVQIAVDGKTVGKLGAAGDVVEKSFSL